MKSIVYTHILCVTQVDKNRTFYNGIGAGGITELQTLFATTLKAETQGYRCILNTIVS